MFSYVGQTGQSKLFEKAFEFSFPIGAADVGDIVDEDGVPEIVLVRDNLIQVWRRKSAVCQYDVMADELLTSSVIENILLLDANVDGRLDIVIGYRNGTIQLAPYSVGATASYRFATLRFF